MDDWKLISPEFHRDCFYGPGATMIDAVSLIDPEASRIRVRWPTHPDMPITRDQRVDPLRHPSHVSGGLMVHMTGIAGFAHAYFVLGLRHSEGWVGFGGRIHAANFRALATPGMPIVIDCHATRVARRATRIICRYDLRFFQGEKLVYEGDQTAMWLKAEGDKGLPTMLADA
jgi:hypothetical protein